MTLWSLLRDNGDNTSIATCQHKLVYFCQDQTRVGAVFRPLHQLKVLPFEMPNTLRYPYDWITELLPFEYGRNLLP